MSSPSPATTTHRWYARPVLFVRDIHEAARFYVERLGFEKRWHADNGAGPVCQVERSECEIILCEEASRAGTGRLFIELTAPGLADWQRELTARGVASRRTHWGYETVQVNDVDGSELFFPHPE